VKRIGVFTSGGDSPGMNAAVRAVVRMAIHQGLEVFAIYEGYQGLVDGGDQIRPIGWNDVGGILQQGGTVIGSARCKEFQLRDGRLRAAYNLIAHEIEGLIIIGGDGSLTGAQVLHEEWAGLVDELAQRQRITPETAVRFNRMHIVGLIGSIDNDMFGSDMTIGADTALHRIVDAIDGIISTAASHQRSFVIEVMGRNCGYLALMAALACGADWVLIPESPPNVDDWESKMCEALAKGRKMGNRDNIVVIAEGARDRNGQPITSQYIKQVLEERSGEDTRITVLGHVQRGGSPSAFDRNLSTLCGTAAVQQMLAFGPDSVPMVMGIRGNKITSTPLQECLAKTHAITKAVKEGNYEEAMELRGHSFRTTFATVRTMIRAKPHEPVPGHRRLRIAVINAGGPAPGMNAAVRTAVRLGLDKGHTMLGIRNGFRGLVDNEIFEMGWMNVAGWSHKGGSELGTNRTLPQGSDFYEIARNLEAHKIEGIIMIGGWTGYQAALTMVQRRREFPAFNIPIICVPTTINNNLPGAELCIGADTALNNIVQAVDKIKETAVASQRVFVVEVMGRYCGYLALMSAMATGAERVYMREDGLTAQDLMNDVNNLVAGFKLGKRLGLMIRSERANDIYTTPFICSLFEEEGRDLFDVRQSILGHLQQGGNPSPFDRIMASRLANESILFLEEQIGQPEPRSVCIGQVQSKIRLTDLEDITRMMDSTYGRPKQQWWLNLRPIAEVLAQSSPETE
jgi:6-phosphofructokinase 1